MVGQRIFAGELAIRANSLTWSWSRTTSPDESGVVEVVIVRHFGHNRENTREVGTARNDEGDGRENYLIH